MIKANVRFRILDEQQVECIHAAAMRVLGETGCEVEHERGLEILKSAGAKVRRSSPPSLPAQCRWPWILAAPCRIPKA